jgi:hypothetical protein
MNAWCGKAVFSLLVPSARVLEVSSHQSTSICTKEYPNPIGKHMDKLEGNIQENPMHH